MAFLKKIFYIVLFFLCVPITMNALEDPAYVDPPKEYIDIMKEYNEKYFHFDRLDWVIRLFLWESSFEPNHRNKNTNGTVDLGIASINSANLEGPDNFIKLFWVKRFPDEKFNWRNPRHSIYLGMAYYNDCLKSTKTKKDYYDAIVGYNAGIGYMLGKYYKTKNILPPTKDEIEFVFQKEFWKTNKNYHYLRNNKIVNMVY